MPNPYTILLCKEFWSESTNLGLRPLRWAHVPQKTWIFGHLKSRNPGRIEYLPNEVTWVWCRCDTAGRTFRFVKIVEMAEANPMMCPDCGVPMNHHADKLRKETHPDDVSAFDSGLGGVIEEFHTCPQCGKTQSRRAPHSETS